MAQTLIQFHIVYLCTVQATHFCIHTLVCMYISTFIPECGFSIRISREMWDAGLVCVSVRVCVQVIINVSTQNP